MLTVSDIEPFIEREFGSRLEPLGFRKLKHRKWVRSKTPLIRELFVLGARLGYKVGFGGENRPRVGRITGWEALIPSFKSSSSRNRAQLKEH